MTPSDDNTIVEVEDLVIRFGNLTASDGVSFSVKKDEIFEFLGPNGAEKTTINSITTVQRHTSGGVSISGHGTSKEYLETRRLIGIA